MNNNDSATKLTQVLEEMKREQGERFSLDKINLSELGRRTGISRKKLRRLKENGFKEKPHGLTGRKAAVTVLTGFTGIIDDLLRKGVYNSAVIHERLEEAGYLGSISQVKKNMLDHKALLPAKRQIVSPQGNRGRRYSTDPGEAYQMDWGFVNVECIDGATFQTACFAMICHHCGQRYIEFFPNAKQENLFIGMIHAFLYMGIPERVLTDNMKSVVIRRDNDGHPIWQHDYEVFMRTVGFETRLCKPRHPFTKGAVERLVRYVKDNFIVGRTFCNLSDLNAEALEWCHKQNNTYHRAVDCVPAEKHITDCARVARELDRTMEIASYLCPARRISFDGFVNYEGRRFGVPYWYTEHECRVKRDGNTVYIYDYGLTRILTSPPVTWSRRDSFCRDQYLDAQPEELPSVSVRSFIRQAEPPRLTDGFSKLTLTGRTAEISENHFEAICQYARTLNIEPFAAGLTQFSHDNNLSEESLLVVEGIFRHMAQLKNEAVVNTLLKTSRLPLKNPKTFENFDFSRLHGKNIDRLTNLPALTAVYAHRNLAFIGPQGVGKTHLAMAYGRACCEKGLKAFFLKASELNQRLLEARRLDRCGSVINFLVKPSCLIIDEVGRCVFDNVNTQLFFDLIDRRYSKEGTSCMIFTSNRQPDTWSEYFSGDSDLLCALDRIFDDASVFIIKGDSFRGQKLETIKLETGPAKPVLGK